MSMRAATRVERGIRGRTWLWLTPLVLVAALLFGTVVGETQIPLATVFRVLAVKLGLADYEIGAVDAGVVWWLSYRIRIEREQVADDLAAKQLGDPRRLAIALSELDRLAIAVACTRSPIPHATREQAFGKITVKPNADSKLTIVANSLHQGNTQDPLGATWY